MFIGNKKCRIYAACGVSQTPRRLYISEVKTMAAIFMIAYIAAAYWATNKIWWSKKVYVYSNATYFYMTRFIICMVAGFVTIPIALLQTLVGKN